MRLKWFVERKRGEKCFQKYKKKKKKEKGINGKRCCAWTPDSGKQTMWGVQVIIISPCPYLHVASGQRFLTNISLYSFYIFPNKWSKWPTRRWACFFYEKLLYTWGYPFSSPHLLLSGPTNSFLLAYNHNKQLHPIFVKPKIIIIF